MVIIRTPWCSVFSNWLCSCSLCQLRVILDYPTLSSTVKGINAISYRLIIVLQAHYCGDHKLLESIPAHLGLWELFEDLEEYMSNTFDEISGELISPRIPFIVCLEQVIDDSLVLIDMFFSLSLMFRTWHLNNIFCLNSQPKCITECLNQVHSRKSTCFNSSCCFKKQHYVLSPINKSLGNILTSCKNEWEHHFNLLVFWASYFLNLKVTMSFICFVLWAPS